MCEGFWGGGGEEIAGTVGWEDLCGTKTTTTRMLKCCRSICSLGIVLSNKQQKAPAGGRGCGPTNRIYSGSDALPSLICRILFWWSAVRIGGWMCLFRADVFLSKSVGVGVLPLQALRSRRIRKVDCGGVNFCFRKR